MARAHTYEPETPMTRDEFLVWAEQQPSGRFERIDGIVVAMAPERASHNRCKRARCPRTAGHGIERPSSVPISACRPSSII